MTTTPSVGPEQLAEAEVILSTATTASNYVSKIDSIARLLSEVMKMLAINVSRGLSHQVQSIAESIVRIGQEHEDTSNQSSTVEKSTSLELADVNVTLSELRGPMSELQYRITSNARASGK